MAEEVTEPPQLTAKDVAKVESLIDPDPLPCGGRGLVAGAPRAWRWSFGKRSTVAVARAHLGLGWPQGTLRRSCPAGIDRCVSHRTDDPAVPPQALTGQRNGVTPPENRAATAPGGNGPSDGPRADEAVLRGRSWATGRGGPAAAGRATPTPNPQHGATGSPPPGLTPSVPPAPAPRMAPGDSGPPAPERGQGAGPNPGDTWGQGTRGTQGTAPRRNKPARHRTPAGWRGRAARTAAAVLTAWALIYGASRCNTAIDRWVEEAPSWPTPDAPRQAPTTPDPLLPPDTTTASSTGPFTPPEPCTPAHCPSLDN